MSFLFLVAVISLLLVGYSVIPKVASGGSFSDDFIFSGFMELLSFLITAAVIGPLAAQYVEWRNDKQWRSARINARDRLNEVLGEIFNSYSMFCNWAGHDEYGFADKHIYTLIKHIEEYVEIYNDEHPVFTASMHDSSSCVRRELSSFLKQIEKTHRIAISMKRFHIKFNGDDANMIHAISGGFDSQFIKGGELHIRGRIDPDVGEIFYIKPFKGIDIKYIRKCWSEFIAASPNNLKVKNQIKPEHVIGFGAQKDAYASWVREYIRDNDELVRKLVGEESDM